MYLTLLVITSDSYGGVSYYLYTGFASSRMKLEGGRLGSVPGVSLFSSFSSGCSGGSLGFPPGGFVFFLPCVRGCFPMCGGSYAASFRGSGISGPIGGGTILFQCVKLSTQGTSFSIGGSAGSSR